MSTSSTLVKELQGQLKVVAADLRGRSEEPDLEWADALRAEYGAALAAGRTGLSWPEWRDGEVDLAAVAWVLGTVFVRFCEDNALLDGVWIAGPGGRLSLAVDAESAFYQGGPERNARDWLREAFRALASTQAGRGVLDPDHSPVWTAPLGADACAGLLSFWREQDANGALLRDLTDGAWDTRFLGDVYQDLSEAAKKKYALLQTPVFLEEFILDQTLTPALAEFGLEGLRLIDPTCGSGHFLLGAFARLLAEWERHAPGLDVRERVQRALDHVHGVDLNPFAVAIARFRLTVAAMKAAGIGTLKDAPAFDYHLAVGDSLLAGYAGVQGDLLADGDGAAGFAYAAEDVSEHPGILERGRYQVVVGNPPYITVKDKALNEAYRKTYTTCSGKYALSVPFMELFFALAQRGDTGASAGFVGQITSNSFMKREFGKKLIEQLLSGADALNPVDLIDVIDTSGAFIPGHGTPTVILVGRRRRPAGATVRAVLGKRGEPGQPDDPAKGLVWTEIDDHLDQPGYDGTYVTITDLDREVLKTHPWSLAGGGAGELKAMLDAAQGQTLGAVIDGSIGFASFPGTDEAFFLGAPWFARHPDSGHLGKQLVIGEVVRDFSVDPSELALAPYDADFEPVALDLRASWGRVLWLLRTTLGATTGFGGVTRKEAGDQWWTWYRWIADRYRTPLSLTFAFVATHNHFVLDRGGKVFKQSAPVIKLPAGATEDEHLDLLGVLNSSTACFWLKQVSHNKGRPGAEAGGADEEWEQRYEFTGTKLQDFPLPSTMPRDRARRLDALARESQSTSPGAIVARGVVSREALDAACIEWVRLRAAMVFEQEELDWEVYRAFGLIGVDVCCGESDGPGLAPGDRPFAIRLARAVEAGEAESTWFGHHNHKFEPVTETPTSWPAEYRDLVERRLNLIESDPFINLLERPEYKRRWATRSWEALEREALTGFVLDKLETAPWWSDGQGPRVLSVAQLADFARKDADLVEALRLLTGAQDVDVTKALAPLVNDEAVPFLAAYRYKPSGLVKRAEWERAWDLQRAEDRGWDGGPAQPIPVPPKYKPGDFVRTSYWQARGKLDVPKERFVSYPAAGREGDPTEVLGWAGWDHAQQALALARLVTDRAADGWETAQLTPLLAGLAELEPWLVQWHHEVVPEFGTSPAEAIRGLLDQQLDTRSLTRTDLATWRP